MVAFGQETLAQATKFAKEKNLIGFPDATFSVIEMPEYARGYAEDPAQDFLPQAGAILLYREPQGPGIRVDSWVTAGTVVPVHYDPLLAKLVAWAPTSILSSL